MLTAVLVCVVFFVIFICGVLLNYADLQNRYKEFSPRENLAVSFGCSTILLAVLSMLLAFVGAFWLRYLMIFYLLVCGAVFFFTQRKTHKRLKLKELFCVNDLGHPPQRCLSRTNI